ncbi:hypothetical protein K435DRAFT_875252 [Dendrothele bispora CBS 962.96]|uniref:Uncharacterized protein n=1 Tax=Dendrothele bispora (strain CBS 962.96) TaxID=1314807 RepID=A0A4S8KV29_DENBC|nr:hypothetical protein K435DRAFT_875252 [Dendrothele bispora CBS 962.96]
MASKKKNERPSTGPSQHLIERIHYLRTLLKNLPDTLPLDPPSHQSTYHFFLAEEDVEERGVFGAVSHSLEIAFGQQHDGLIHFEERGQRLEEGLIKMLKDGVKKMTEGDRKAFEDAWLERLIQYAKADGATTVKNKQKGPELKPSEKPAKKKQRTLEKPIEINTSDSGEDSETHLPHKSSTHSANPPNPTEIDVQPPQTMVPKRLKQQTLKISKDTRTEEEKRVAMLKRMREAEQKQAEYEEKQERLKQEQQDRKRMLARERQKTQSLMRRSDRELALLWA